MYNLIIDVLLIFFVIILYFDMRRLQKNQNTLIDNDSKMTKKINFIGIDIVNEIREKVDEDKDVIIALLQHLKLNAKQEAGKEDWKIIKNKNGKRK